MLSSRRISVLVNTTVGSKYFAHTVDVHWCCREPRHGRDRNALLDCIEVIHQSKVLIWWVGQLQKALRHQSPRVDCTLVTTSLNEIGKWAKVLKKSTVSESSPDTSMNCRAKGPTCTSLFEESLHHQQLAQLKAGSQYSENVANCADTCSYVCLCVMPTEVACKKLLLNVIAQHVRTYVQNTWVLRDRTVQVVKAQFNFSRPSYAAKKIAKKTYT